MPLFYAEANLFLRAGDDMRFGDWLAGDSVRQVEQLKKKWSRA